MIVSVNWLKRYLNLDHISIDELSKTLTRVGLEVEGVQDNATRYGSIIVGKVVECIKHPNSDRLSKTVVYDGAQNVPVVCGAPNVSAGQTVAFAPVGTTLYDEAGKSFTIKKAKLRGEESHGMICAEDEIGLGEGHAGILVLPSDLEAGKTLKDLGFYDVLLEVNVTPNRPDALNHIGIARELAQSLKIEWKNPLDDVSILDVKAGSVSIELQDPTSCSRYTGTEIKGVAITDSPIWMQNLLRAVGVRPVNNIVDITNFILLETGQPLHAFDLDLLGSEVVVRRAHQGEELEAINHSNYKMLDSDLIICKGQSPACIAGVMGGKKTEVHDGTVNIFLECAWFNPGVIRKQSRRLGLSSDSSYRFERGVDPLLTSVVASYAAQMITQICGGTIYAFQDCITSNHRQNAQNIAFRPARVAQLLGMSVSAERCLEIFTGLGCRVLPTSSERWNVAVPGFRPDLEREVDLIEEIARINGFDDIPLEYPSFKLALQPLPAKEQLARKIRMVLRESGLNESVSLRFDSKKNIEHFYGKVPANVVELMNPLSEDLAVLPVSLIPRFMSAASRNIRNREKSVSLFEWSKAYFRKTEAQISKTETGVIENEILGMLVMGEQVVHSWQKGSVILPDFFYMKGILEKLMQELNQNLAWERSHYEFLHPGQQVDVLLNGKKAGWMGRIHPSIAKNYDLQQAVYACELQIENFDIAATEAKRYQIFARTGVVSREISMLVDCKMTHQQILMKIEHVQAKFLCGVELIDIYEGQGIPEGKKNLLYKFLYQDPNGTLTDDVVNAEQQKIADFLLENGEIGYR